MKKSCAVFLVMMFCLCIASLPAFAESNEWLYSEIQIDLQNDGSYDEVINYTYDYNPDDRLTKITRIKTQGPNIMPKITTFTYDILGNKITEQITGYMGSVNPDWINDGVINFSDLYTYTYDSSRNQTKVTYAHDDEGDGTIDSFIQRNYTYDANGNVTNYKVDIDDNNDGSIDVVRIEKYTYDANGNKTFELRTSDKDNDGSSDLIFKDTYTYDVGGNLILEINEYDYDNDGIIDEKINTTYSYIYNVSGKIINKTIDYFDSNGTHTAVYIHTDTYDIDGNRIFQKRESDSNNDGIFNFDSTTQGYNPDGQLVYSAEDLLNDGNFDRMQYSTWQLANSNDVDNDGDKFKENQGDCNDTDSSVNPGAVEICEDGIDQDCNGSDLSCTDPSDVDDDGDGYTENQGDCDDTDSTIFPGAIEICGDGIDQDCNGSDLACVSGPSPPTGVAASDDTFLNKVQVTWNPAAGITTYDIFRADMPAWTGTAPRRIATSVTGNLYDDTTAVENSRYYYWVKSRDGSSVSKYSHFDPGYWGMSGTAPAKPTSVAATDNGPIANTVQISWNPVSDTLVYEIWRGDIPAFLGGKTKKIGTSTTNSYNAYDDATVVDGNRYYYWIKARNSWGVSRYSIFDTGYIGTVSSPLPAPTNVSATDGTVSGKVTITWNSVSGSMVYEVWRTTKPVSEGGKPKRISFLSDTTFDDTTGSSGMTYYYWVKSRDSWGSSKYSVPDTGYRN